MSLLRTLVTVVVLSSTLLLSSAQAQPEPGFFGKGDDNSDFTGLYDPFCDLDFQWFEPIHCECPVRPLNSGWFFGYSRETMNVTRPRDTVIPTWDPGPTFTVLEPLIDQSTAGSDYDGDWGWGNRFDFGWVSEDGTGIWFVARKFDIEESITYDNIDLNLDSGLRPDEEDYNPTTTTLNGLRMWGIEANKVWRLEPTPKGHIIEPFVGVRYAKVRDDSDRSDIYTDATEKLLFGGPGVGVPGVTEQVTVAFNYQDSIRTVDNDLFGGQLGMRSRWRRGRWHITSDVRGLAFWNHQVRKTRLDNEFQYQTFNGTFGDDGAGGGILTAITPVTGVLQDFDQEQHVEQSNTFVYGGEFHLDVAFEVTQGFAINVGGQVIAFADGIGRGLEGTDDSLLLSGVSLGFTFNR